MSEAPAAVDAHLRESLVSRTELLQGHFLHVVRDTVRLPSGREATREFVLHPGAVMVIALLDDGQVVLERQFRHPMQQVMVEFPAGKLDAGEPSQVCAQRELREETGYTAREWAFAGRLAPTIAYSNEVIDIWFARGLSVACVWRIRGIYQPYTKTKRRIRRLTAQNNPRRLSETPRQ